MGKRTSFAEGNLVLCPRRIKRCLRQAALLDFPIFCAEFHAVVREDEFLRFSSPYPRGTNVTRLVRIELPRQSDANHRKLVFSYMTRAFARNFQDSFFGSQTRRSPLRLCQPYLLTVYTQPLNERLRNLLYSETTKA